MTHDPSHPPGATFAASLAPPPPLPAAHFAPPIGYLDETMSVRPWATLVRGVGTVGLVASSLTLLQFALIILPMVGIRILAVGVTPLWPRLISPASSSVLLLIGSAGCVGLRPWGRGVMIAYSVVAALASLASLALTLIPLGRGTTSPMLGGFGVYLALGMGAQLAFPAATLVLMLHPSVRRVFQSGSQT